MVIETLVGILLDVLVVGMLLTTVVFCAKLNRRILVLQDSKGDMAQLIRKFDEATEKASSAVGDLQDASKKLQEDMGAKIQKANFIADDLAFMIEKGNKVAEKMLSSAVQQPGMAGARSSSAPSSAAEESSGGRPLPASRGPRVNTNSAPDAPAANPAPRPNPAGNAASGKAALESVMERLGNKAPTPGANPATPKAANIRSRSKTEQELLDALKNDV